MRGWQRIALGTAACGLAILPFSLCAQTSLSGQEALEWLQKIPAAARQASYSGTFVFQSGQRSETARLVHLAAGVDQFEKLEVLDGSPREVIRHNEEVKCFLPEKRLLVIERRGARNNFPGLISISRSALAELLAYYRISDGGRGRVAGRDSQFIRLEPLDEWRLARNFWVDREQGLLLKHETLGAQGEALESLSFTELTLGVPAGKSAVQTSFDIARQRAEGWEIRQAKLQEMQGDDIWQFRNDLPGFRRQTALLRSHPQAADGRLREVRHWVFSDGLAAISVFITAAPAGQTEVDDVLQTRGATSVLERYIAGHHVVVMGDVAPAAIRRFASGIVMRTP